MANKRKDERRKRIRQLRKEGLTMPAIAEKENLPGRQWVYYFLKKD